MPPPAVTMRVRAVFVGTAAALAAQTAYVRRYGEPYPAVVMPGFEGSGGYKDGRVQLTRYEAAFVSADGAEVVVPPKVLLAEFPDSHHWAIASTALMPPSPAGPPGPPGRFDRIRLALFPGYAAGRRTRGSPEATASLREWFGRRAAVLAPGRAVERAEVRWFREVLRVVDGEVRADGPREPVGTLVVPLSGGPA